MSQRLKHFFTIIVLVICMLVMCVLTGALRVRSGSSTPELDPFKEYGYFITSILYILRLLTLIPLPLTVCNILGIVCFNCYPSTPVLRTSLLFGPFVCFRVVTKGTYPELVKRNIQRNIESCMKLGLTNFVFEVVTDSAIGVSKSAQVRELVVPDKYRTKNGTLYKARALQYCLEEGVNILSDNDWIIHLDEETLITESSLIGVINFINDGQYEFGQGVITYANEEIVSWITTLADSIRVGIDYGILRFTMKFLHRPVFSWKGSFIVANAGAERKITYDFGQEGSIAEDCFFALTAWKEGYKFGFVEGEMWEKSTFSVMDYIRQRKRWVQGISKVISSKSIPFQYKGGINLMMIAWVVLPFTVPNVVLAPLFPLPLFGFINLILSLMGGAMIFLFTFGALKSFSHRRHILFNFALCVMILCIMPVAMIMEATGIVLAFMSSKNSGFHVVKKDIHETPLLSHV
ncbi:hypothetical protein SNE40_017123 [Patella caerulea]|uniref:Glycosyltransferase 2-like domain-containing protein n=1 Tax=Patella caerulea TaxID=87958 RepID=A0AAN8J9U7_PATCE